MTNLVNFTALNEMLYGDERYIKEFAAAAILTFSEFNTHYAKFLAKRDEENFRRAGHKVKPVAQMLGLEQIIEEYERGKALIWEEQSDKELEKSINTIDSICSQVLTELETVISD